ncbi:adenine phosphoribosyltransferase [bacterium]|nr:adenine phosphoribosyltransferase [bacterium]
MLSFTRSLQRLPLQRLQRLPLQRLQPLMRRISVDNQSRRPNKFWTRAAFGATFFSAGFLSYAVVDSMVPLNQRGVDEWTRQIPTASDDKQTSDKTRKKYIASVTPFFPFKGIDRFVDIQGFLKDPKAFRYVVELFVKRYENANVDCVVGIDARGFVLGPPVALALGVPFVMMRKKGKMPNTVGSKEYTKEYDEPADSLHVSKGVITSGQRVVVVDDVVASGGTLDAACGLVQSLGATVHECACVIQVTSLKAGKKVDAPIWAALSEEDM